MNLRRFLFLIFCAIVIVGLWFLATPSTQATPPNPPILQLTDSKFSDVRPAWSPDNRMIAFQSNRNSDTFHIYVMNADGSNQRALTQGNNDDRHPIWMPDGKSILFDSNDGKQTEIWQVNLADGQLKQITHLGVQASFVAPSADGQRIAFYVYQNETLDLWTARIDGSQAKQLTTNLASATNNQCTFPCHSAAWSPDNRSIAYSAGELDAIWMISADGGNPTQVIADGGDNHFPWFLADGRLGYITEHVNPARAWTDAWAYDLQTGKTTLLQEQMAAQGPFEWNKDNSKVLFHSPRAGNFAIYLIDLSSPDGVSALQGKLVPMATANPSASTDPAPSAPANSSMDYGLVLIGTSALIVLMLGGIAGLVIWRKRR